MFNSFVELFFGQGYEPNDFELMFALIFFVLVFHGFCSLIEAIKGSMK